MPSRVPGSGSNEGVGSDGNAAQLVQFGSLSYYVDDSSFGSDEDGDLERASTAQRQRALEQQRQQQRAARAARRGALIPGPFTARLEPIADLGDDEAVTATYESNADDHDDTGGADAGGGGGGVTAADGAGGAAAEAVTDQPQQEGRAASSSSRVVEQLVSDIETGGFNQQPKQ